MKNNGKKKEIPQEKKSWWMQRRFWRIYTNTCMYTQTKKKEIVIKIYILEE